MKKFMLFLIIVFNALTIGHSLADGLEKIQFLKISPQDHRAVMKNAEGKLQIIGVSDAIGGALVTEIAAGGVVLRQGEDGHFPA